MQCPHLVFYFSDLLNLLDLEGNFTHDNEKRSFNFRYGPWD